MNVFKVFLHFKIWRSRLYGNTGCGVSRSGIQNPIDFCLKYIWFFGYFKLNLPIGMGINRWDWKTGTYNVEFVAFHTWNFHQQYFWGENWPLHKYMTSHQLWWLLSPVCQKSGRKTCMLRHLLRLSFCHRRPKSKNKHMLIRVCHRVTSLEQLSVADFSGE